MDNLAPVRAFFKELITPIVTDAVKQALPNADESGNGRKMPVAEVTRVYGIAQSTIYLRFKTGQLTKYKQNGLTFVDVDELEQSMTEEKLCAVLPEKADKRSSKR